MRRRSRACRPLALSPSAQALGVHPRSALPGLCWRNFLTNCPNLLFDFTFQPATACRGRPLFKAHGVRLPPDSTLPTAAISRIVSAKRLLAASPAMLRREARQRKEFLYRKSLEGKRASDYNKRVAIRTALAEGRPIPTELRRAEPRLSKADALVDALHDAPTSHIDDEYANAANAPPHVVVTTSRDPSSRLAQFAKELRLIFPAAQRLNRGNLVMDDLVSACRANAVSDIVVVHEHRGQPDGLIVSHLPFGPTAYFNLRNVVMRHDVDPQQLGTMSEAAPHLIFHGFDTRLGRRLSDVLKYLFPVPKPDSKRVMTFANFSDQISFRHHVYRKNGHRKEQVDLKEVGPRFEMQLYQLRLGTLDQQEADDEWVLRPHMNTAKRRRVLG